MRAATVGPTPAQAECIPSHTQTAGAAHLALSSLPATSGAVGASIIKPEPGSAPAMRAANNAGTNAGVGTWMKRHPGDAGSGLLCQIRIKLDPGLVLGEATPASGSAVLVKPEPDAMPGWQAATQVLTAARWRTTEGLSCALLPSAVPEDMELDTLSAPMRTLASMQRAAKRRPRPFPWSCRSIYLSGNLRTTVGPDPVQQPTQRPSVDRTAPEAHAAQPQHARGRVRGRGISRPQTRQKAAAQTTCPATASDASDSSGSSKHQGSPDAPSDSDSGADGIGRTSSRAHMPPQSTKARPHATSKYKGVHWDKSTGRWHANILHEHKSVYIGRYVDEVKAARAYDQAALRLRGSTEGTNFPDTAASDKLDPKPRRGSSQYRGVSWSKTKGKWIPQINHGGHVRFLGQYDDQLEAARAFDLAVVQLRRTTKGTNFPDTAANGPNVPYTARATASQYRGVTWHKETKKWHASTQINGKRHYFGLFEDELEAAKAFDRGVWMLRGSTEYTNFPETAADSPSPDAPAAFLQPKGTSKYMGVCWETRSAKWIAQFHHNGSCRRQPPKSSQYKGVFWCNQKMKWKAGIIFKTKQHQLGFFVDEVDAAKAYDEAVVRLRGTTKGHQGTLVCI
ncbi:hypothetical protein WJX72_012082 [[Myrmecia] bisecta]|uniref:AP2/ERF domain-containing protein n=1 Tax=[Myrmecia] bisecta TaxID=41462 RepID=A0AAW1P5H3_9CHLO